MVAAMTSAHTDNNLAFWLTYIYEHWVCSAAKRVADKCNWVTFAKSIYMYIRREVIKKTYTSKTHGPRAYGKQEVVCKNIFISIYVISEVDGRGKPLMCFVGFEVCARVYKMVCDGRTHALISFA